jgi:hypothetical protein
MDVRDWKSCAWEEIGSRGGSCVGAGGRLGNGHGAVRSANAQPHHRPLSGGWPGPAAAREPSRQVHQAQGLPRGSARARWHPAGLHLPERGTCLLWPSLLLNSRNDSSFREGKVHHLKATCSVSMSGLQHSTLVGADNLGC